MSTKVQRHNRKAGTRNLGQSAKFSLELPRSPRPYIIRGWYPTNLRNNRLRTAIHVDHYNIPIEKEKLIRNASSQDSPLSSENYFERFQWLLHLEEVEMKEDIKKYNMEDAPMVTDRSNKDLLILKVPGVSERRPCLLQGDQLLVRPSGESGGPGRVVKYQGYVHQVELGLDRVKLGFSRRLPFYGMKFSVEFKVNRLTLRIQHRAAELMSRHGLKEVLFPTGTTSSPELRPFSPFDKQLNPEQCKAVQHIVAGSSKPAPYLVFGPPGTGKTATVVEAIKQIEETQDSCHILACAPSNSAADLLCKKLLEDREGRSVFRLYPKSYSGYVPFKECSQCNLKGNRFEIPSRSVLKKYKVLVTTLITASRLVTGGIGEDHYTSIFIDEAHRATETQCILPLAGLLNPRKGQVVLAGDPEQLGPIIRSHLARKHGLGLSLLTRLMNDFDQRKEGKSDERFVTKLQKNYRSHSDILQFPSERFYGSKVVACAEKKKCEYYIGWEHLPNKVNKNFPVIFHGVVGEDKCEGNSLSFFNQKEVEVLMDYVTKLLQTRDRYKTKPEDIGIIAPYRKQVEKIRKELKTVGRDLGMNLDKLKVSSVEEFQGEERKVILVSAVRSNAKNAETDQKFGLGFVNNDKRFNVAMTRAEALLIVVGNPIVLKIDDTWHKFIQYCRDKGGYYGTDSSNSENEE